MYACVSIQDGNSVTDIKDITYNLPNLYFWVECPDNCRPGMIYKDGKFVEYVPPPPNADQNKLKAISLLTATDWVTFPDVLNTSIIPHLLNQDEFIEYRRQLRIISLDPIDGNIDWPVIPVEKWVK
jgi:hypothetical protein